MIPVLSELTTSCVVCGEIACERDLVYVETEAEAAAADARVGEAICRECADAIEAPTVTVTYSLYDGDPDVSGGTVLPDAEDIEITADTLEEAMGEVRDAMEIYAAGLSAGDDYTPGDHLYALVWHDGGTERLVYALTADDLGIAQEGR